ncbi:MAG: DUF3800 domain-containing protein [Bacteroidetes bacterium]|nr:DUF3800 domain-containing protein [Bacteroidota bacterium]
MKELINIYCDESCHLQNDGENVMALGAIWCPEAKKSEIFYRIKELKEKHKLIPKKINDPNSNRSAYEIKWNKVSAAKIEFFKELIDFFFTDDDLHFRVLIVPDKKGLNYEGFGHTHDTFYYKMYFDMLKIILNPEYSHNIYIDIKDTRSREKVHKLEEVLRNNRYDFSKEIIRKVQQVRSHEVELIQLADLFTGAVSYVHRGLISSKTKLKLIEHIKHRSHYSLLKSTLVKESKFNIFVWRSSKFKNSL